MPDDTERILNLIHRTLDDRELGPDAMRSVPDDAGELPECRHSGCPVGGPCARPWDGGNGITIMGAMMPRLAVAQSGGIRYGYDDDGQVRRIEGVTLMALSLGPGLCGDDCPLCHPEPGGHAYMLLDETADLPDDRDTPDEDRGTPGALTAAAGWDERVGFTAEGDRLAIGVLPGPLATLPTLDEYRAATLYRQASVVEPWPGGSYSASSPNTGQLGIEPPPDQEPLPRVSVAAYLRAGRGPQAHQVTPSAALTLPTVPRPPAVSADTLARLEAACGRLTDAGATWQRAAERAGRRLSELGMAVIDRSAYSAARAARQLAERIPVTLTIDTSRYGPEMMSLIYGGSVRADDFGIEPLRDEPTPQVIETVAERALRLRRERNTGPRQDRFARRGMR